MSEIIRSRRAMLAGLSAMTLAGCARDLSELPVADHVVIDKTRRSMALLQGRQTVASYDVQLGFAPRGHKTREGDGRTPEGRYFIDRKNPRSAFHLSLGISYPNAEDLARARAAGVEPGGDIFIHGGPRPGRDRGGPDWTAGCIAVTNREVEEVYAMVRMGTLVTILA